MTETSLARDPIAQIHDLFARRGDLAYGEAIDQLQHALQSARLAELRGEGPAMITACLLHDIGHMQHEDAAAALACGDDDGHESIGMHFLLPWFSDQVVAPVALHVQAKRYLAAVDAEYLAQLSRVSRHTLDLQAGPMSLVEAATFARLPFASAAIRLRRIDEAAKVPGASTPPLSHYLRIAAGCRRDRRAK